MLFLNSIANVGFGLHKYKLRFQRNTVLDHVNLIPRPIDFEHTFVQADIDNEHRFVHPKSQQHCGCITALFRFEFFPILLFQHVLEWIFYFWTFSYFTTASCNIIFNHWSTCCFTICHSCICALTQFAWRYFPWMKWKMYSIRNGFAFTSLKKNEVFIVVSK